MARHSGKQKVRAASSLPPIPPNPNDPALVTDPHAGSVVVAGQLGPGRAGGGCPSPGLAPPDAKAKGTLAAVGGGRSVMAAAAGAEAVGRSHLAAAGALAREDHGREGRSARAGAGGTSPGEKPGGRAGRT